MWIQSKFIFRHMYLFQHQINFSGKNLATLRLLVDISFQKNLSDVRQELMRRENISGKPQQTPSGLREPAVSLPSPYRDRSASIDVDNLVIGALETAFKEMVMYLNISTVHAWIILLDYGYVCVSEKNCIVHLKSLVCLKKTKSERHYCCI